MKRIRTINIAFLLMVSISVLLPLFAGRLFTGVTIHQSMIIGEVVYVAVALAVVALLDRPLIGQIQQAPMSGMTIALVVLFGLLIQPVSLWLNLFSQLFVTNYVTETMNSMGNSFLFNLLYAAVAPAIAEEFIFRGLFYHGYRQIGILRSAALTGLLFGLMHMNLNQFVYAFALGVLLALLVEATGSIYAAMMVHFMINGRSVVLLAASQQMSAAVASAGTAEVSRTMILQALLVYTPIALGCAAGMFFLIRRIAKLSGRSEYFDLVMQGQEQSVRRRHRDSADEVRMSEEKMCADAADVLEGSRNLAGMQMDPAGWTPAERAARFVAEPDEEWERAGTREKWLAALPAIAAALICLGYMLWLELA